MMDHFRCVLHERQAKDEKNALELSSTERKDLVKKMMRFLLIKGEELTSSSNCRCVCNVALLLLLSSSSLMLIVLLL